MKNWTKLYSNMSLKCSHSIVILRVWIIRKNMYKCDKRVSLMLLKKLNINLYCWLIKFWLGRVLSLKRSSFQIWMLCSRVKLDWDLGLVLLICRIVILMLRLISLRGVICRISIYLFRIIWMSRIIFRWRVVLWCRL